MKFALSVPNSGSPGRLVDLAASAEASGWDGFFLWDHVHLFREMRLDLHDPWVVLGAVASAPDRIALGTMVTPLPRRHPQKFAKEVTTLDHLAAGRVIVGVGLGFPPEDEFTMFGQSADNRERAERLDEALDLVTSLWSGEPVDHRGNHYTVSAQLLPTPVQRPRPPIWIAGEWPAPGPLKRAMRFEGYFPIGANGQPLGIDQLPLVSATVPGKDLIASWLPGSSVADYATAGVTWLVESRWPDGNWLAELERVASDDPRTLD